MKRLLSWIFHPWLMAALGLLALSLVIWWVGPLVAVAGRAPLASELVRAVVIAVVVGGYLAVKLAAAWRTRRANSAVVDQLLRPAPASAEAPQEPAEVKLLRERFEQGLQTLRQTRFDGGTAKSSAAGSVWEQLSARVSKRYLYQLPWYIFIGAPGSGKTTALLNAGLRFPLAGQLGQTQARGVAGIAGTRNCDWWFTDEAVLIDTAGRYTTQDSDRDADKTAWDGFMGLLKSSRPRQPINGALVTVSVSDLLTRSAADRAREAGAVRARVQELHQQLGVRFPVYLLVTKCDLLAGFMDYLGPVDKEQRAAPWGFTFPLDAQQRTDLSGFLTEFDLLEQRLTDGLIDRLQPERDLGRRARIYAFPQQFNALRQVLKEFVDEVFAPSPFEEHPLLRGVYFISGTQEGTPLDRMLGGLTRNLQLDRAAMPPNQASGKSFFLERLLREVVFAESALGGTNLKWERRRHALALAGYAGIALVCLVAAGLWTRSTMLNRDTVAQVDQRTEALRVALQSDPARLSSDVVALLPLLDQTRALVGQESSSWAAGFGLDQRPKLADAAQQAYERMLQEALLPRIALRVEEQVAGSMDNADVQYDALKTAVMLHDPAHFQPDWIRAYLQADWAANLPREVTAEQRANLLAHLDALLARGAVSSPIKANEALIAQARARLTPTPLANRVYNRLQRVRLGADIPDFTAVRAGGPSTPLVFTRASGKPLTEGVPGFYTYEGYHKAFNGVVKDATAELAAEETWVLGVQDSARTATLKDPMAASRLVDDVRRIYLTDYTSRWSGFIDDLRMLPTDNLSKAVQMSKVLTAPDSPLKPLLREIVRHTTLTPSANPNASVIDQAEKRLTTLAKEKVLAPILGDAQAASVARGDSLEKTLVDDRFTALRLLVTSPDGKGPAPIDGTVALINDIYTQLNATETAVQGGNAPPPSDVPNRAKAEAGRLPPPMKALLQSLSVSGTKAALDATRGNLSQAVRSEITTFCQQATAGRYPFDRGSARDVTQDDFARLFAPGGLMDQFVQKNLLTFVDTTTRPWSFRKVDGASMGSGLSAGALRQFQHAAEIRDAFFRAGGTTPSVKLDFKPLEMDATITQFLLDVDGQTVKYAHGPAIPGTVQWPGPRGNALVRVALSPVASTGSSGLTTEGPWALFRLFDRLQITPGNGPERFTATFNLDGRKAVFEVTSSSVQNPLRLAALRNFSCPTGL